MVTRKPHLHLATSQAPPPAPATPGRLSIETIFAAAGLIGLALMGGVLLRFLVALLG